MNYCRTKVSTIDLQKQIQGTTDNHLLHLPKRLSSYVANLIDLANQSTIKEVLGYLKLTQKATWLIIGVGYLITVFIPTLFPFSSPNFWFLPIWVLALATCFATFSLNRFVLDVTTRIEGQTHAEREDTTLKLLSASRIQSTAGLIWVISLPIAWYVIPFFNNLLLHPNPSITNSHALVSIAGNQLIFRLVWLALMIMVGYRHFNFDLYEEQRYRVQIKKWADLYRFHYAPLHTLLEGAFPAHYPVITIGESILTHDKVDLLPMDTLTNYMIVGSIGQGKTSTAFEPAIKQYLDYYAMYIRAYPELIKNPNFATRGVAPTYCNGLVVIETTNSLNSDVADMAIKLGIPKSFITILNPEDPHTDSFNVMRGPVAKAAEVVVSVVQGLSHESNDFFQIKEKTNLRSYVYLAKLASVVEDRQPDFNDVYQMYLQPQLIHDRQQHLKVYIDLLRLKFNKVKKLHDKVTESLHITSEDLKKLEDEYSSNRDYKKLAYFRNDQDARQQVIAKVIAGQIKEDTDNLQDAIKEMSKIRFEYLELKDKLTIAQQTDLWFDANIEVEDVKLTINGAKVTVQKYHDINEQFVGGLTAQLDTLAQSPGIRRVLFRDSGTFNLDDHFRNGGVLLMNTGKGALGSLSQTLGSIFVSVVENATFRRMPNVEPIHPVYMDEVVDYMPETFQDFPSQSRKYNVPLIVAFQSLAQINNKFNQDFTNVLLNVFRIKAVFGDIDPIEANTLSAMFGSKTIFTEDHDEHDVNEVNAAGRAVSKTRQKAVDVPNMTPDQLVNMEPYTMAIRHSVNNEAQQFDQVRVNRITDDTLAQDSNRIDLANNTDYQAYQALLTNAGSLNPDFDAIDQEIREHIKRGDYNNLPSYKDCLEVDSKISQITYGLLPAYDADSLGSNNSLQNQQTGKVSTERFGRTEETDEDSQLKPKERMQPKVDRKLSNSASRNKAGKKPLNKGTAVSVNDLKKASSNNRPVSTPAGSNGKFKDPEASEDDDIANHPLSTPNSSRGHSKASRTSKNNDSSIYSASASAGPQITSETSKESESSTSNNQLTSVRDASKGTSEASSTLASNDGTNYLSSTQKDTKSVSRAYSASKNSDSTSYPAVDQDHSKDISETSNKAYTTEYFRKIAEETPMTDVKSQTNVGKGITVSKSHENEHNTSVDKYLVEIDDILHRNTTIKAKIQDLKMFLVVLNSQNQEVSSYGLKAREQVRAYVFDAIKILSSKDQPAKKTSKPKVIDANASPEDYMKAFNGLSNDPLDDTNNVDEDNSFFNQNGM